MTRTIHIGYFFWKNHFPSSHYSTIKHGFIYSTKRLPVRAFTIRGPLWSSSIFTSYQPWKNNNESYLHQTLLGPLPKTLCYGSFFKSWHQWQPTLINTLHPTLWTMHLDEHGTPCSNLERSKSAWSQVYVSRCPCNIPTTILKFSLISTESEPPKYLRRPSVS